MSALEPRDSKATRTYLSKLVNGGMRTKVQMQAATLTLPETSETKDPLSVNIAMGGL